MKVRKEWIGSKKPATKGDLADLQEDIHVDLQQFATKQDLKEAVNGLMTKETGEELLNLIKSIDKRLRNWDWIPGAVKDLQKRVFKLEIRSGK